MCPLRCWRRSAPLLVGGLLLLLGGAPAPAQPPPDKKEPSRLAMEVLKQPVSRAELQKQLAQSKEPALRQTRLGRVYFHHENTMKGPAIELRFEGVCLFPIPKDQAVGDLLLRPLTDMFTRGYPELDRKIKDQKVAFSLSVEGIKPLELAEQPATLLQQMAAMDRSLDGVLFQETYFGPEGKLHVHGLITDRAQVPAIDKMLETLSEKQLAWLKPVGAEKQWSLDRGLAVWQPLPLLQGALARGEKAAPQPDEKVAPQERDRMLRQTLVTRAHFVADRADRKLKIEGVCLHPKPDADVLLRRVTEACTQEWGKLQTAGQLQVALKPSIAVDDVKPEKSPVAVLQQTASDRPELDGLLFNAAFYDAAGTLHLEGLKAGDSHEKEADGLLAELAAQKPAWLRAAGDGKAWKLNMVTWAPLAVLQHGLASQEADPEKPRLQPLCQQTLVRRAWFRWNDQTLNLWVEGVCIHPDFKKDTDPEQIRRELTTACAEEWKKVQGQGKLEYPIVASIPTERIDGVESPVFVLQKQSQQDAELDGILFTRGSYDRYGTLLIEGFVCAPEHVKKAEALLRKLEEEKPLWIQTAAAGARPRWTVTLRKYALPIRREGLQGKLSTGRNPLLRQTRLDRLYFAYLPGRQLELRLEGVCINPGWREQEDASRRFVTDAFLELWQNELPEATRPGMSLVGIQEVDSPLPQLQLQATQDRRLDGLLFFRAEYDQNSTLQLSSRVSARELGATARQMALDIRPEDPCLRPWEGKGPRMTMDVQVGGPPLQPALQERLAESTERAEHRQLRIDRAHFAYADRDPRRLELRVEGLSLDPAYTKGPEAATVGSVKAVTEKLEEELALYWPGVRASASLAGVEGVAQPGAALQKRVAGLPALDGVRLYQGAQPRGAEAFFDRGGQLVLQGLYEGPAQEEALRELVATHYRGSTLRPEANGLVLKLRPAPTRQVLTQLRELAAEQLEDVLLERLYFDGEGRLKLQGFITGPDDQARLLAELRKVQEKLSRGPAPARVVASLLLTALVDLPPEEPGARSPVLDLTQRQGLTAYLRRLLQTPREPGEFPDPRWDGVYLRRGYYDPEGVYWVTGLFGEAPQRERLAALLGELRLVGWDRQLPQGWQLDLVEVLPVGPMLEALNVVMPAYPVFDGLTAHRVYHEPKGQLNLVVTVVGAVDAEAATQVKVLLDGHGAWKARSFAGVHLLPAAAPRPRDLGTAAVAQGRAIAALSTCQPEVARELIGTAILHRPDSSTAWFVRAMCGLILGDELEARRDLRRVVPLEEGQVATAVQSLVVRLERISRLQGPWRRQLNEELVQAANDLAQGKPPLTLAEVSPARP